MPTHAEGLGLTVNSPCNADWDSMAGDEQIRFCAHCDKSVRDLSQMTRGEALRFVRAAGPGLCVRFQTRTDGRALHAHEGGLHRIAGRASRAAAGAFGAVVALGSSVLAQPSASEVSRTAVVVNRDAGADSRVGGSLTGTVLDANGALVAGASVTAFNKLTGEAKTATTNAEGVYVFESLKAGIYTVTFMAEGFERAQAEKVELQEGVEQRQDSTLAAVNAEPAPTPAPAAQKEDERVITELPRLTATVDATLPTEDAKKLTTLAVMGGAIVITPKDPLVRAVFEGETRAAKELIALGANVNVLDKEAKTTALMQAVLRDDEELVSALIGAGADVNMRDEQGQTALMNIYDETPVEIVRKLIAAGAKVNARDDDGGTALMAAASADSAPALKELLDAGAKVNAKDKEGMTALMRAAQYGYTENVKLLLAAGADACAKNKEGETALSLAKQSEPAEFEESKERGGLKETEGHREWRELIELLVSYGAVE